MLKKQNILYAPKISFKIHKKFPKFLDLINNSFKSKESDIGFFNLKRKDSTSTTSSDNN